MDKYTVDFQEDESGWWVARLRDVKGCHTQGRTRESAMSRLREAASLFDVPEDSIFEVGDVVPY